MCGISGIISLNNVPITTTDIAGMNHAGKHRGPDGQGYLLAKINKDSWQLQEINESNILDSYQTSQWTVALGHSRLAILDLTPAGHQPMSSADKKLWIVHNGEIYNYLELRQELELKGYKFSSHTDTEVILAAYWAWGIDCLSRFNGMWSFAILDLNQNKLFCARDRAGIKPFYYYYDGTCFLFASELKQIMVHPKVQKKINNGVLYDYLVYGYSDHSEQTFYQSINQLRGAHYLVVPLTQDSHQLPAPIRYWNIDLGNKITGWSDQQYADRFLELFEDSIRLHLRSDVPVGSCLSGGLDSSGIVCMVNKILRAEGKEAMQNTVSSCFEDKKYDERQFIDQITKFTEVTPHCTFPSGDKLIGEIDQVLYHQDEPFGSTSIYAQWNVFRLAKETGLTVMLDGQGADEILAGYHSYYKDYFISLARQGKLVRLLKEASSYYGMYRSLAYIRNAFFTLLLPKCLKHWRQQKSVVPAKWLSKEFREVGAKMSPYNKFLKTVDESHNLKSGSYLDQKLYEMFFTTCLPALLHYEDRNSMAFSIESRVPFLDYRLVEFMFALPDEQKIKNGWTKYVYRNAMRNILPEAVRLRQDKMGFVTPEEPWIRNTIRQDCLNIIKQVPDNDPIFNKAGLNKSFNEIFRQKQGFGFLPWRWINTILWANKPAPKRR